MPFTRAKDMMTGRLIDSLYTEAMLLADEARSYFDQIGRADRDTLGAVERVAFSCESLKVTTRLLHVIAWLLTRKAVAAGEIAAEEARSEGRRLGQSPVTDVAAVARLPDEAREIIEASIELYDRVARIDRDMIEPEPASPARDLLRRIERTL